MTDQTTGEVDIAAVSLPWELAPHLKLLPALRSPPHLSSPISHSRETSHSIAAYTIFNISYLPLPTILLPSPLLHYSTSHPLSISADLCLSLGIPDT
jgi:hypothetical protein